MAKLPPVPQPGSRFWHRGQAHARDHARNNRPAGTEPPVTVFDMRHQRIELGIHASGAIFVLLEAVRLAQEIERTVFDLGVDPAQVFPNNTQSDELNTGQKQHDYHQ